MYFWLFLLRRLGLFFGVFTFGHGLSFQCAVAWCRIGMALAAVVHGLSVQNARGVVDGHHSCLQTHEPGKNSRLAKLR